MKAFWAIACLTILSGCVGSQTHLRDLENNGVVRVDRSNAKDSDYVVSIRNVIHDFDPDNPESRREVAQKMMATQCPQNTVVGEDIIETGTWLGGRPSRTYAVRVKCKSA
jgi:hypothetical protein